MLVRVPTYTELGQSSCAVKARGHRTLKAGEQLTPWNFGSSLIEWRNQLVTTAHLGRYGPGLVFLDALL